MHGWNTTTEEYGEEKSMKLQTALLSDFKRKEKNGVRAPDGMGIGYV